MSPNHLAASQVLFSATSGGQSDTVQTRTRTVMLRSSLWMCWRRMEDRRFDSPKHDFLPRGIRRERRKEIKEYVCIKRKEKSSVYKVKRNKEGEKKIREITKGTRYILRRGSDFFFFLLYVTIETILEWTAFYGFQQMLVFPWKWNRSSQTKCTNTCRLKQKPRLNCCLKSWMKRKTELALWWKKVYGGCFFSTHNYSSPSAFFLLRVFLGLNLTFNNYQEKIVC